MQGDIERARQLHNDAIALARSAKAAQACDKLRDAVAVAGEADVDPRTLKALWQLARAEGDWRTALAAGMRGSIRDPLDFAFTAEVVRSLHDCPLTALVPESVYAPKTLPSSLPTLSIIVVSRDDRRYDEVGAQIDMAFVHWPHERIRIRDASSMYDGYARGFAQSSGEVVVFSHDDIRFAVPDFAARLADAISSADIAGVAGTTRVSGPALHWSGHPHLHGAITHKAPTDTSYELALMSLRGPRVEGAQALDGVFIAARRAWVERVGFDTAGVPGFHLYDVDFSYRAHLAGARIAIACDLGLVHQSRGHLDAAWTAAQEAWAAKFPGLRLNAQAAAEKRHWYHTSLPDEASVTMHYAKLFAAWQLRLL